MRSNSPRHTSTTSAFLLHMRRSRKSEGGKRRRLALAVLLVAGLGVAGARAGEGLFSQTYAVDLLPAGHFEFEQTVRGRFERSFGSYQAFDGLTELEYGVTDNLQLGFYLNSGYVKAKGAPDEDDPLGATGFNRKRAFVRGISTELIYRVLDPVKEPVGLALYIEPEWNFADPHNGLAYDKSFGVEYKVLLQKNFLDDRLILALNLGLETEWNRYKGAKSYDGDLDWSNSLGISYRVAPNWNLGWELYNHNEYANFKNFEHAVLWTGPSIHYGGEKFWATLGVLRQVCGTPNGIDENGTFIGNGLFERSQEKWEITFKVGFPF